jgi:UDP-glucose 4-epimerase
MKIAITGASGFISSRLIKKLISDNNHEIICLSSSIKSSSYKYWSASMSPKDTAKILKKCDLVIHLAAYIPLKQNDYVEAKKCIDVNSLGTLNILQACILANVKRFVYISSFNIFSIDKKSNKKIIDCKNASYYLGSKFLGEIYVKSNNFSQLSTLIIRLSSVYGKGMRKEVINTISQKLIKNQKITLNNNGQNQSDFLYIDDCVSAIRDLSLSKYVGDVDIGSGVATKIYNLVIYIADVLSIKKKIKLVSKDSNNQKVYNAVDITKLQSIIKFSPTTIKEGLKKMFKKYKI